MQGASKKLNTAIARALSFLRVASAQVEQSAVVFAPTAAVDRVKAAPAPAPDCERLPGVPIWAPRAVDAPIKIEKCCFEHGRARNRYRLNWFRTVNCGVLRQEMGRQIFYMPRQGVDCQCVCLWMDFVDLQTNRDRQTVTRVSVGFVTMLVPVGRSV